MTGGQPPPLEVPATLAAAIRPAGAASAAFLCATQGLPCPCWKPQDLSQPPVWKEASVSFVSWALFCCPQPGLSAIVTAVIGARKIFQRMTTYARYTVAMTFRICFTFGLITVIYDW